MANLDMSGTLAKNMKLRIHVQMHVYMYNVHVHQAYRTTPKKVGDDRQGLLQYT